MSTSAPPPPDYTGAANQQSTASQQLAAGNTQANRPNQTNPWGSMTWSQGPDGQWTQNTSLNPAAQGALDAQQQQQQASQFGTSLLGQAQHSLSSPFDLSFAPQVGSGDAARQAASNAVYSQATSRLDPQWAKMQEQQQSQLAAQGIDPTSEAGRNASDQMSRQRTDAYNQANLGAIQMGGQEAQRQQGMDINAQQNYISNLIRQRQEPLQEYQSLMSGQGVQSPQFAGFNQATMGQAPQLLQAAMGIGQYGLQAADMNNQFWGSAMSGLGQVGAAAAPALIGLSDEQCKTDIERLPEEAFPGVPWARWKWREGHAGLTFGVVAQDLQKVRPDLVYRGEDGLLRVDYSRVPIPPPEVWEQQMRSRGET